MSYANFILPVWLKTFASVTAGSGKNISLVINIIQVILYACNIQLLVTFNGQVCLLQRFHGIRND